MKRILVAIMVVAAGTYLFNAHWRVAPPEGGIQLIAHRGVHQNFDSTGLGNNGCSATRIDRPTHDYLENTLPSIEAAFAAGADLVEFDVHPTTDGQFAVMHDWTIDCRTEGKGETRSHDMAYLKTLDVGYGYTADGGKTFPFRGKGVGLMPEIREVFSAFPKRKFLVNYKSNEEREGDMLADLVKTQPEWRDLIWGVYGGRPPTYRARELIGPDSRGQPLVAFASRDVMNCLVQYLALGWSGYVPDICRNTAIMLPINLAWLAWGWPNLFLQRMRDAGTEVILLGPYEAGDPGTNGIDTLEELAQVPEGFTGYIWTNKIELIGPAVTGQ
ncbi:MAG TPA: glycerophosphodiester phosphodiesterase family protein [Devosia sp.]